MYVAILVKRINYELAHLLLKPMLFVIYASVIRMVPVLYVPDIADLVQVALGGYAYILASNRPLQLIAA